jgi:hypothetical protein
LAGLRDRDCLQRSLLLYRVLSRAGADPTLMVGFLRRNGRIRGHAWVTVDGNPVIEPGPNVVHFSPALGFGPRGAPIGTPSDLNPSKDHPYLLKEGPDAQSPLLALGKGSASDVGG